VNTRWRTYAALLLAALLTGGLLVGCGPRTDEEPAENGPAIEDPAPPTVDPDEMDPLPDPTEDDPAVTEPEEPAPSEEPSVEDPAIDVEIDNWLNPVGLAAMQAELRELVWVWTSFENGVAQDPVEISYRYVGSDTVAGVEASKIELVIDGEPWTLWTDDRGTVLKAEIAGEVLPAEMAVTVVGPMITGLFSPFAMVEAYDVRGVIAGFGPGWEVRSTDVGTQRIGDLEARVHEIEVTMSGPPYTALGEQVSLTWAVADFGAFQMLVEWRTGDPEAAGQAGFRMRVERVIPR